MREVFENNMREYGKRPENRTQNMHKLGEGYAGTLNTCQTTQKAVSNLGEISKQVFWTAMLTCFFSSCRMGELVVGNELSFDPKTTLKWVNLAFTNDTDVLLFIPFTKTKGARGEFVDLFSFPDKCFCPVANLLKLKSLLQEKNIFNPNLPVFTLESGLFLTKNKINTLLESFLSDLYDSKHF